MIKEYKSKTNIFIGGGILLDLLGMFVLPDGVGRVACGLVGRALLITGCVFYVKGKCRHPAWGAMGFLSLLGLIVLICLKDKSKEA